jgi:GT2 family glycosyltransferase
MDRLDLGAVILNWNGRDDTLACLQSIYEQGSVPAYVVVVDNGSADDSVAAVHDWAAGHARFRAQPASGNDSDRVREFTLHDRRLSAVGEDGDKDAPRLVTISNGANLGFAAGNNVGIRFLLDRDLKYVLLLNNDTVLGPDAFAELVDGMERSPDCQCMVPQIRYASDPDRIWNCGARWSWIGAPRYYYAEEKASALDGKGPFGVELVTGCALIIRTRWLMTHGLLTERFFFGEEDVELSWRMRQTGKGSMYCWPDSVIYHKVGASLTRRGDIGIVPKVYCHYLNRMIFLRSIWGAGLRWQARRLMVLAWFGRNLVSRFGFSPGAAMKVVRDLARDSREKTGVDAKFFAWLMKEKFATGRVA